MQINNRFSGHETFQCKSFWLKKGYDYWITKKSFSDNDAIVHLGVGKNMVSSIHFWLKSFNIISPDNQISEIAYFLFDNEKGKDLYLEDTNTLWLLHYLLISSKYATIYNLLFLEFRKERIEFSNEHLTDFINNIHTNINENTLRSDINVIFKNYLANNSAKTIDDKMDSLFLELNIFSEFIADFNGNKVHYYQFNISEKKELNSAIILFAIKDLFQNRTSISFEELEQTIGYIFLLNTSGLYRKIQELVQKYPTSIIYKDDAGRKEIQLKNIPSTQEILNGYYQ